MASNGFVLLFCESVCQAQVFTSFYPGLLFIIDLLSLFYITQHSSSYFTSSFSLFYFPLHNSSLKAFPPENILCTAYKYNHNRILTALKRRNCVNIYYHILILYFTNTVEFGLLLVFLQKRLLIKESLNKVHKIGKKIHNYEYVIHVIIMIRIMNIHVNINCDLHVYNG